MEGIGSYVILDFGKEMNGGIRLFLPIIIRNLPARNNQTVVMQFENGIKTNLTMTAFTALLGRKPFDGACGGKIQKNGRGLPRT